MDNMIRDDKARQGPKGRPVLMVLIGSMALLAIYMVGMMAWSGSTSNPGTSQEAARESNDPQTTSSTNSRNVPAANPAYPSPTTRSANPNAENQATPMGGPKQP